MSTVEKSLKQLSYKQTAKDFEVWRAKNPDADLKRQVQAFNSIADSNLNNQKKLRPKKAVAKTQKAPKRI